MAEKIYKTMTWSGIVGIITGTVTIIIGLCAGILMIVAGAKLLMDKKGMTI